MDCLRGKRYIPPFCVRVPLLAQAYFEARELRGSTRWAASSKTSIHLPNPDDNGILVRLPVKRLKQPEHTLYTLNPYMLAELPFLLRGR